VGIALAWWLHRGVIGRLGGWDGRWALRMAIVCAAIVLISAVFGSSDGYLSMWLDGD
jgi:hypothetical protein